MSRSACVLVACLALWPALLDRADAAGVGGEFRGDGLVITVDEQPAGVAGFIEKDSARWPLSASKTADGWAGAFTVGEQRFACTAALDGDHLVFSTGSRRYQLKRVAPRNPLDGTPDAAGPARPPLDRPGIRWMRHPAGFRFTPPRGYRLEVGEQFVELYKGDAEQPVAFMRLAGVEDPAFTRIDDPDYLKAAIASMIKEEPGLKSSDEVTTFAYGRQQVASIAMTLKVEELDQPVPARVMLFNLGGKKVGILLSAWRKADDAKAVEHECLEMVRSIADDLGMGPKPDRPGKADDGASDAGANPLLGRWVSGLMLWEFGDTTLKRKANPDALGGARLGSREKINLYRIKGNELRLLKGLEPGEGDEVFAFEITGDQCMLTPAGGGDCVELKRGR